jgi:hypothetical protein
LPLNINESSLTLLRQVGHVLPLSSTSQINQMIT